MHFIMYYDDIDHEYRAESVDFYPKSSGVARVIEWPRGTWFQQRRALLLQQQAEDLLS